MMIDVDPRGIGVLGIIDGRIGTIDMRIETIIKIMIETGMTQEEAEVEVVIDQEDEEEVDIETITADEMIIDGDFAFFCSFYELFELF